MFLSLRVGEDYVELDLVEWIRIGFTRGETPLLDHALCGVISASRLGVSHRCSEASRLPAVASEAVASEAIPDFPIKDLRVTGSIFRSSSLMPPWFDS